MIRLLAILILLTLPLAANDRLDRRPDARCQLNVSANSGAPLDRGFAARVATMASGASVVSRVMDFDGSTTCQITYPDADVFESAPFSVSFWARLDSITSRVSLVGKNTTTAAPVLYRGWYIHYIGTSAGSYGMVLATNTDASNYISKYTGSPSTYNDGVWRHFVCVVDSASSGTNWKIYVNGAAASLSTLSAGTVGTLANSEPFTLSGFTTANQTARLNGALDNVHFFNVALTPAEAGELYITESQESRP